MMSLLKAIRHLGSGEFSADSMGPKVKAVAAYAEKTCRSALIADVERLEEASMARPGQWIWSKWY